MYLLRKMKHGGFFPPRTSVNLHLNPTALPVKIRCGCMQKGFGHLYLFCQQDLSLCTFNASLQLMILSGGFTCISIRKQPRCRDEAAATQMSLNPRWHRMLLIQDLKSNLANSGKPISGDGSWRYLSASALWRSTGM